MSNSSEALVPIDPDVLKKIHIRARRDQFKFEGAALSTAKIDFGWGVDKIRKCILKLNGNPWKLNPARNHYWKSVPLLGNRYPGMCLYHFRAEDIMEGFSVYTHIFLADDDLGVSSFKQL